MKIAHLSDLHICSKFKRENIIKTKKLIRHAIEQGVDHFVITGDISDNAQEKDFLILRKILETYKLLSADKTSIIIGNHDIFGGVHTVSDVINFPSKCANTNYKEKVTKFFKYFKELFENAIFPSEESPFPYVKVLKDVVLIGMNSIDTYSKLKNPFASNGHVSKIERENLKKIFDEYEFPNKMKIAMVHHHFYNKNIPSKSSENSLWNRIEKFTMKLRGKKKLLKLFSEIGISLVLHGHSHEIKEYHRKGIMFLNAGGSIDNETADETGLFIIETNNLGYMVNLDLLKVNSNEVQAHTFVDSLAPSFAQ